MLIVDAQVHIWSAGRPANLNHRQIERFTKDDLLKEMDAVGRAVCAWLDWKR